ncbi:facilitated trehalose transporter Tret1-like isoform X1 [Diorhabda carinulata]|uniref:facilitated trehalose transporter Tret1-like isoform X1 n=2 Tax=Diorhabda carinulata TaxID=1163345 RepID=UPI0025A0B603|nr:facilitated trehalose transporter Tret1-like isoform X1 [Diorhabda carinulata]
MKLFDCSKFQFRIFQYLAALAANLGMFSMGLHYGWPSLAIPDLTSGKYSFNLTDSEASWIVAVTPLGSIIGDVAAGFTLNTFGRKTMIWFSSIPLTVSWILIAVATAPVYLFAARILAGIIDGFLFTAIPPYLAEISDPEIRGFLGTTYFVTLVFGMMLSNVMLMFISIPTSAYISASVSLLMLIILPFLPESPYFYVIKKEMSLATSSLQKFRGKGEITEELERISNGIEEENKLGKGTFYELVFTPQNRNCLILALAMTALQQLTGILAIQSYCDILFNETNDILSANVGNLIYFVIYFVGTSIALFVIDIFGRKPLVLFSTSIICVTLLTDATFLYIKSSTDVDVRGFDYVQIISILIYIAAFSIGLNCVPILVSSEIFPSHIKGKAFCLINVCFSLVSSGVVQFFSWSKGFGLEVPFYTFAFVSLIGTIFLAVYLPETKGKTLEDVQSRMKNLRGKKGNVV